jgi:hypothetical protein
MKCIPFLATFTLAFLPIAVEGIVDCLVLSFLLLYTLLGGCITFDPAGCESSRTFDDCNSLMGGYVGLNSTVINDQCTCDDDNGFGLRCIRMKERICISPTSDPAFCTNYTDVSDGGVYEIKLTPKPSTGRYFFPPVVNSEVVTIYTGNIIDFHFEVLDGASSESKKYTKCEILFDGRETCTSCDICDNGIDFKYDCSNVNYTYAADTLTTSSFRPGPKVETCFPVANVIPSF